MSVDILYNLGDDALQNLFNMVLPPFPGVLDPVSTTFRITGFTIPQSGIGTYEIHYKSQMITKPNGKIDDPKTFDITYRVDSNWNIYNGFKNWKNLIANTATGVIAPDTLRIPIIVYTTDGNGDPTGGKWLFEDCFIQTLGDVSFDYTNGDPIEHTVTFQYKKLNDVVPV